MAQLAGEVFHSMVSEEVLHDAVLAELDEGLLPCVEAFVTDEATARAVNAFRADYAGYRRGHAKGARGEVADAADGARPSAALRAFWDASERAAAAAATARETRPLLLVVGSSVALGSGASSATVAWAGRLSAALALRGVELRNEAVSGKETAYTLGRLQAVMPAFIKPHVLFLSLSLANEGLRFAAHDDVSAMEAIGDRFLKGSRAIVEHAAESGAAVVLGLSYAHAWFGASHASELRRVNSALVELAAEFDGLVVDFYAATVDEASGGGDWFEGHTYDEGHPNDEGHESMFRVIDHVAISKLALDRHAARPACDIALDFVPPTPLSWTQPPADAPPAPPTDAPPDAAL
ncbi:SGNH hydrolase-type esterase domain-containing protein [Pelagophyceae sp. CCMP2097]|nr:SGNH hydrolase-type esterase domain-containing protein [Pelagophyceae sp. CCMP2097]